MNSSISVALQYEALFGKAREFIRRGLRAKAIKELGEYQLWASLALELLGKAALANIHPCLVADPVHPPSLFAAAGRQISSDVKTIAAHTVFDRIKHLSRHFDTEAHEFCKNLSIRRNSELHSGELALSLSPPDVWEKRYWRVAEIILETFEADLDTWLGADEAKAPRKLIEEAAEARLQAAQDAVHQARARFEVRYKTKQQQEKARRQSHQLQIGPFIRNFQLAADTYWHRPCPACESECILAGTLLNEQVSDLQDEDSWMEYVTKSFNAEELYCPICELHIRGTDSLEGIGIETGEEVEEEREREYEPEYDNE
jgi:hypothetical protein